MDAMWVDNVATAAGSFNPRARDGRDYSHVMSF